MTCSENRRAKNLKSISTNPEKKYPKVRKGSVVGINRLWWKGFVEEISFEPEMK